MEMTYSVDISRVSAGWVFPLEKRPSPLFPSGTRRRKSLCACKECVLHSTSLRVEYWYVWTVWKFSIWMLGQFSTHISSVTYFYQLPYEYWLYALGYNLIQLNFVGEVIIFFMFLVSGRCQKALAFEWLQICLLAKEGLTARIRGPFAPSPNWCVLCEMVTP